MQISYLYDANWTVKACVWGCKSMHLGELLIIENEEKSKFAQTD